MGSEVLLFGGLWQLVSLRVVSEPLSDLLKFEGLSLVVERFILVVFAVESDRGVASQQQALNFVGRVVVFGDYKVVEGIGLLSELLPRRFQVIAVGAVRRIMRNENVLGRVHHDPVVIRADKSDH